MSNWELKVVENHGDLRGSTATEELFVPTKTLFDDIQAQLKYIPKKYIYDFDHNSLWFAYKNEQGSLPEMFDLQMLPVIGFAPDWITISIADINVRQQLRQMLF
jgi:hypothetical protein